MRLSTFLPVSLAGGTQSSAGVSRVARRVAPATDGTLRELSGLHPETTLWRLGLRRLRPSGPHSPTQGTGVGGGRRTPAGGVLGRRSTAPPLLRLREAGLGLAGPGSSRTPADGELVIPRLRDRPPPLEAPPQVGGADVPGGGAVPVLAAPGPTLGTGEPGRPRSSSPQHQPHAPGHSDPHASFSRVASDRVLAPPRLARQDPLGRGRA